MEIAKTPAVPYYAVIFTSVRTSNDTGFDETAQLVTQMVQHQPGFLGFENVEGPLNIMVSYWDTAASILAWRQHVDHLMVQKMGKELWYERYKIRIARVERDYGYEKDEN